MRDARELRLWHSVNQAEIDELLTDGRGTKTRLQNLERSQRRHSWSIAKCLSFLLKKITLQVCDHGNDIVTKIYPAKLRTMPKIIVVFRCNKSYYKRRFNSRVIADMNM